MAKKVDLIIIGAQKCATTTLFDMLSEHPEVEASRSKETNFFSKSADWRRGLPNYHALFAKEAPVWLEASPSYTQRPLWNANIWDDMYDYNPDLKLIYLVRSPLDRMKSAYKHKWERGWIPGELSYDEFLTGDEVAIKGSSYAFQVRPFLNRFGRENVLILKFDDLIRNHHETLQEVARFAGLDETAMRSIHPSHSNAGADRRYHHTLNMNAQYLKVFSRIAPGLYAKWLARRSPELVGPVTATRGSKQLFLDGMKDDIVDLEHLTGWDLDNWKTLPVEPQSVP